MIDVVTAVVMLLAAAATILGIWAPGPVVVVIAVFVLWERTDRRRERELEAARRARLRAAARDPRR